MIGDAGPGSYRLGLGGTPPDLTVSVAETISTQESQGGYTADPDHLAVYLFEEIAVADLSLLPMMVRGVFETIAITEVLHMGLNLAIRRSETISVDEFIRLYSPMRMLLEVFEVIAVKDVRPTLRSPQLIVRLAETITVTEGALNPGASGTSGVIGPSPAPLSIPDDYWTVGV